MFICIYLFVLCLGERGSEKDYSSDLICNLRILTFLFSFIECLRSLQFILAEELEHEKRVLEDLKTAVQAHLTQLHTEEIILSGMLDFNIEGVVVPKLPIREEMVMCGMGFGENEEGREYGSVGEGVDVEFQATVDVGVQEEVDEVQDERIEEDWARELEWEEETEEEEEEEEDGVNGNFPFFWFNYLFFPSSMLD